MILDKEQIATTAETKSMLSTIITSIKNLIVIDVTNQ